MHPMPSTRARDYFEFLAEIGMTKHYGSMEATRELIELCHIGIGQIVLDVGCGVGATPSFLANKTDCRVIGLDLVERMLEKSREQAINEGVLERVEFLAGDGQNLPFKDDCFDAVIMESVNVFFSDKLAPTREYIRVTRPGGYVGFTEMTWLQPPYPEVENAFRRAAFATALDAAGWIDLLKEAGLKRVTGNAYQIDVPVESKGRIERYGRWNLLKTILKTLVSVITDRKSRSFINDGISGVSRDLLNVVGYGVYAGQKSMS